jgi:hypothetical protein
MDGMCTKGEPELLEFDDNHYVACYLRQGELGMVAEKGVAR